MVVEIPLSTLVEATSPLLTMLAETIATLFGVSLVVFGIVLFSMAIGRKFSGDIIDRALWALLGAAMCGAGIRVILAMFEKWGLVVIT